MRRFKRLIHKRFGGLGNFFAMTIIVSITVIFINTYVLSKRNISDNFSDQSFFGVEQKYNQSQNEIGSLMKPLQRPSNPDPECAIDEICSHGSIPFKASSGQGTEMHPFICFNNKLLVHKNLKDSRVSRGINLVALDGKTFEIKFIENFDTYLEETFFLRSLRLKLNESDIVILASHDEMTHGLREASLDLIERYGSQLIKKVKYRDSFVMIGQKGLARGKAIESHQSKGRREFGSTAQISGCAKFPLGKITPLTFPAMEVNKQGKIAVGSTVHNCGLSETCKEDEFSVHVYTGKDNNDEPKICVNGKYVISKGINDAGRGLNMVVVANGKEVIRTGHFDTWKEDSTNLEIFLENLEDDVIVIAVTFDEASSKLSQHSKNLFFDLGSATIQNLKYRDVWVLVGQKGINGFSPYEEISYAGFGSNYAPPIDKRMCIPRSLKGVPIRPDPLPYRNDKRRDFCTRYDGYGDFCSDTNVDKILVAIPLINKTLEDNPIYSTPILVIAGTSHNSLRMCLETLLMQPGINPENVVVTANENFSEPLVLIDLFGFRGEKISNTSTYMQHYEKSLEKIWELFPNKDHVIVIEEDLILSPDFLYTLALLSETFRKDETIGAIQMWNPNSYDVINGSIELIYRVDQFFGLGYLLRRTFYEKTMKNSFDDCCNKRVWEKWIFSDSSTFLMPDVSRVFRRPVDGNRIDKKHVETLFNRKRKTSLNPFPSISNIDTLRKDKYDAALVESILSARLIKSLENCEITNGTLDSIIGNQNSDSDSYKYIYNQNSRNDLQSLLLILPCFQLFPHEPLGLYNGILRFYSNQYHFYLVGSKSPFYKTLSTSS